MLAGDRTHAELCREHQLSPSVLTLWKESALERLATYIPEQALARMERGRT